MVSLIPVHPRNIFQLQQLFHLIHSGSWLQIPQCYVFVEPSTSACCNVTQVQNLLIITCSLMVLINCNYYVFWCVCVCEIIEMSLLAHKSTLYLQRLQMYDLYSQQEHFKARLLFTIITGYCHCITIITLHIIAHHYSSVIHICDAKCDSETYGYGTD